MTRKSLFVVGAAFLLVTGTAVAQPQLSTTPNPPAAPSGVVEGGLPCGDTAITQSVDPTTIISLNSVSCNAGGLHTDNSYFRAFDLATDFGIADDFEVCAVDFGIETAVGAGGSQPATLNLYTAAPGTFPVDPGTLTNIASAAMTIPDQDLTIFTQNIAGVVPSGDELIVEVFTPDGQTVGNSFFIGSNNLGETGPSYLAAADCGLPVPNTTASIGFPEMQIVMTVYGAPVGGNPLEIPTLNTLGIAILVGLLGLGGFVLLRRRS